MVASNQVAKRRLHATAQHFAPATQTAESITDDYPTTHEQISNPVDTANYIDNQFVQSKSLNVD